MKNELKKAKKLAEEHCGWLVTWLRIVYIDAFIHGYKHGVENSKKEQ